MVGDRLEAAGERSIGEQPTAEPYDRDQRGDTRRRAPVVLEERGDETDQRLVDDTEEDAGNRSATTSAVVSGSGPPGSQWL